MVIDTRRSLPVFGQECGVRGGRFRAASGPLCHCCRFQQILFHGVDARGVGQLLTVLGANVEHVGYSSLDGRDLGQVDGEVVCGEGAGHVEKKTGPVRGRNFNDGVEVAGSIVHGDDGVEYRACPLPVPG